LAVTGFCLKKNVVDRFVVVAACCFLLHPAIAAVSIEKEQSSLVASL
jgi:hypothetical protein